MGQTNWQTDRPNRLTDWQTDIVTSRVACTRLKNIKIIDLFSFQSFSSKLPWMHCDQVWNTNECREYPFRKSTTVPSPDFNRYNYPSDPYNSTLDPYGWSGVLIYKSVSDFNVTIVQPGGDIFIGRTAFVKSNFATVRFAHTKNWSHLFSSPKHDFRQTNLVSNIS